VEAINVFVPYTEGSSLSSGVGFLNAGFDDLLKSLKGNRRWDALGVVLSKIKELDPHIN
jgi:hypothetical protein